MRRIRIFLPLLAFVLPLLMPAALAAAPDELPADPALMVRARALDAELRCMTCQGESLAESDAPLARDMRRLVRARLEAGESDDEIKAYLVGRYGEFILMRPPVRGRTLPLWLAPLMLFICAGAAFWRYARADTRRE